MAGRLLLTALLVLAACSPGDSPTGRVLLSVTADEDIERLLVSWVGADGDIYRHGPLDVPEGLTGKDDLIGVDLDGLPEVGDGGTFELEVVGERGGEVQGAFRASVDLSPFAPVHVHLGALVEGCDQDDDLVLDCDVEGCCPNGPLFGDCAPDDGTSWTCAEGDATPDLPDVVDPADPPDAEPEADGDDPTDPDADAGPEPAVPTCGDYCYAFQLQCPEHPAYGAYDCTQVCDEWAGWSVGDLADPEGDTLACRQDAAEDGDCEAAAPDGGGVCGDYCGVYCSLASRNCTDEHAIYDGGQDCVTACAEWDSTGQVGADHADTVQCRLEQLLLAAADPGDQCEQAGPDSELCAAEVAPGPCDECDGDPHAVCFDEQCWYEPTCDLLCEVAATSCPDTKKSECAEVCVQTSWDPGGFETDTNTLGCRIIRLLQGACQEWDPFSGGACASQCETYCGVVDANCPGAISGRSECVDECAALSADGEAWDEEGDTVQCRLTHALWGGGNCTSAGIDSALCSDLSCEAYCETVTKTCTGDEAQYESQQECLDVCTTWLAWGIGDKGDDSDNTVACRIHWTAVAAAGPASEHCDAAGPTGGGVCGSWCLNFCDAAMKNCGLFPTHDACLDECEHVPTDGVFTSSGDSVQCRLWHAMYAGQPAGEAFYCEKASIEDSKVCVEPDDCVAELCNDADDDCDGEIDEDFEPGGGTTYEGGPYTADAGKALGEPCGTGACSDGVVVCEPASGEKLTCDTLDLAEPELCGDAVDNDCDGELNEGCAPDALPEIAFVEISSSSSPADRWIELHVHGTEDLQGLQLDYREWTSGPEPSDPTWLATLVAQTPSASGRVVIAASDETAGGDSAATWPWIYSISQDKNIQLRLVTADYDGIGKPSVDVVIDEIHVPMIALAKAPWEGRSYQLTSGLEGALTDQNDSQANWCHTPAAIGDDLPDGSYGTPGEANKVCTPATYTDVQPIFQDKCDSCHTTGASGGHNIAGDGDAAAVGSYSCTGLTVGECALVRIFKGEMPLGKGCAGPVLIDGPLSADCITEAEMTVIEAWVDAGMKP